MLKFLLLTLVLIFSLEKTFAMHGSPKAKTGGTLYINLGSIPKKLNPIADGDAYSSEIADYVMDTLLAQDPETYEYVPNLASSYEVSKSGLEFTFTLREGATFHDGKPVTVEDVKFSFEILKSDVYEAHAVKPYLKDIVKCEIIGKNQVKFTATKKYFGNLSALAGMILQIFPKHIYDNPSEKKKKKLNKVMIGSGPYILDKFDRKRGITLKKNPNWWGKDLPLYKGKHNFKKIYMRFIKDPVVALETYKKGKLDYIALRPEDYVKKTSGKGWGKNFIKVKTQNKAPKSYSYIALNQKNKILKDRRVRKALYYLLDRGTMIDKFLFNMSYPLAGPLYQNSPYVDSSVKPILYNPKKAVDLLKKAGWKDTDGDKVLDKVIDGVKTPLKIVALIPNESFMKYMTIYKEDAKKAGVNIETKLIEWTSFLKQLDDQKFDAAVLAWGRGSVHWDPKQIWHSDSAVKGGSNFISYKNPKVDKLIDDARGVMDAKKRAPLLKKVYKMIAEDVPYLFLFSSKNSLYTHNKKIQKVKPTYKYAIGQAYWWFD